MFLPRLMDSIFYSSLLRSRALQNTGLALLDFIFLDRYSLWWWPWLSLHLFWWGNKKWARDKNRYSPKQIWLAQHLWELKTSRRKSIITVHCCFSSVTFYAILFIGHIIFSDEWWTNKKHEIVLYLIILYETYS